MFYHAKILYAGTKELLISNWNEETIIEKTIIPFFNGHIIHITDEREKPRMLNLKCASELRVYRTMFELNANIHSIRDQMSAIEFEDYDYTDEIIKKAKISRTSVQSQSLLEKTLSVEKNQVFIIMKYRDKELDSAYEGVIKEVFKEFNLTVIRVDEIEDSGKISDQVLENIARSKFVFCELIGERPNCYFETGFAYALGKEIILSIFKDDKIHFDLAGNRFIQWETENDLRNKLKTRVKSLIEDK